MSTTNPALQNPFRRLQPGCYVVQFLPDLPYQGPDDHPSDRSRGVEEYLGTLRVVVYEDASDRYRAHHHEPGQPLGEFFRLSGDLYAFPANARRPSYEEIPIFPRDDYRFHLRARAVRPWVHGGFDLTLESHEFRDGRWRPPHSIELRLAWLQAQGQDFNPFDSLEGEVRLSGGPRIGRVRLTWVSSSLRRAIVELDTIGGLRAPTEARQQDGTFRSDWRTAFEPAGWLIDHHKSDQPVTAPSQVWAEFELQQALPALRDSNDTDHEWRYHVFCVGQLEDQSRGYQFDARGTDGKQGYFESIVLAAHFKFPDDPEWGGVKDTLLQDTALYFRVAVHEVGHAMKLEHNESNCGFMATTDGILQEALRRSRSSPNILDCISWSFAPADLERLRHWPDIVVRPGGHVERLPIPGIDSTTPEHSTELEPDVVRPAGLVLVLNPIAEWFPIGAPVRIDLRLENRGKDTHYVPKLRLKAGTLSGWVRRGDSTFGFLTLARTLDNQRLDRLGPGESATGSISLLRGPDGALFGEPGPSQVTVKLDWFHEGRRHGLFGTTSVNISTWIDDDHRKSATRLITTKDTLAGFAIGGDGFADGNQAINLALANPVLRPHFAVIRFRRMIRDAANQTGNLGRLLRELCAPDANTFILADTEVRRLADLLLAVNHRGREGLGTEKMLVALRLIVGRISNATLAAARPLMPGNVTFEQGLTAKGTPKRGRKRPEAATDAALAKLAHSIRHALNGLDPSRPSAPAGQAAASENAPSRRALLSDMAPEEIRNEVAALGIPLERLPQLLQRLRRAGVTEGEVDDAAMTIVEAMHRHLPLGIVHQSRDIHAALVANFVANLVIGGVQVSPTVLKTAAFPFNEVSPLDRLLQFAGRDQSFGKMDSPSMAALGKVSDEFNREFALKVAEFLASGPAKPEPLRRLHSLADQIRDLASPTTSDE